MTTAAPDKPTNWEDYVKSFTTPDAFLKSFQDGEVQQKMVEYGNAYFEQKNTAMKDLSEMVAEQTQLAVAAMFERNGLDAPKLDLSLQGKAARQGVDAGVYGAADAPGAVLNGKFKNKSEFFKAAIGVCHGDAMMLSKYPDLKAFSENDGAAGGVLVPEEVRTEILTRGLEDAVVRSKAQVIPMPSGKLKYPAVDFTTEVGEVFGGMVAYWMDEGQTIPLSEASFAEIELDSNRLAIRANPPNGLLRHAPAFNGWLSTNMPKAAVHFEDRSFMKGDGVKKPLGQLHPANPSLIIVDAEAGQAISAGGPGGITWANVLDMVSRFLPEGLASGEWDIAPEALREVMTMAVAVGTGGAPVMAVTAPQAGPATLWGMPIRWTRKAVGRLNSVGDISLTDYSQYVIGDTMQMRVESSMHEQFSADRTVFRLMEEVDGRPQLLSALTPEYNGPTLSATVQLAART